MIKAIVYSNPGCMPCRMVKKHLKKLGIEFEERSASEWGEYLTQLINNYGLDASAPLVEYNIDGKVHYTTGNRVADLEAVAFLAKETA